MELPVYNVLGAEVGKVQVADNLVAVPMNQAVVHQAMVRQHANGRQGTADTKTRGMVSGGGRKPWGQKYTGRSRQGSTRAPHWRKGGVVFGPHPRSYHQAMPKKMRRLAIRCVLSQKARENHLTLLEALEFPKAQTQQVVDLLKNLKVTSKVLLVTPEANRQVVLSARNLQKVKTLPASNLNVLDLLDYDQLVMTVGAVRRAEELWGGVSGAAPEEDSASLAPATGAGVPQEIAAPGEPDAPVADHEEA